MTPEQLKWTDKQWAEHLKCSATDLPRFKNYLQENFWLALWQERDSGLKYAQVQLLHPTPSGFPRYIPIATSKAGNMSTEQLIHYTNNVFVPSLELKPMVAEIHGVPCKILQMLHINEKQK